MTQPSIPTRVTERYGVRHPFALATMAFAGWAPPLAIAVSHAGGIGSIGAALLPEPAIRGLAEALHGAGAAPFNFGFLSNFDHDAQVRACAELKVPVVTFHWGHPDPALIRLLKDAGCDVWQQVATLEQARRALGDGVDLIVAQGHEAGGHNLNGRTDDGQGLFTLLPTLRDALGEDVLMLASGGVADGRGVAAALQLGADGVWVGTRMVATAEANAHDEYKRRLVQAGGTDTVYSWIFGNEDPGFNPMRVLRSKAVVDWNHRLGEVPLPISERPLIGTTVLGGETVPLRQFERLLPIPETEGDWDQMPFLAGQGVGLIHDVAPAGEVVERMMTQAAELLARGLRVRA